MRNGDLTLMIAIMTALLGCGPRGAPDGTSGISKSTPQERLALVYPAFHSMPAFSDVSESEFVGEAIKAINANQDSETLIRDFEAKAAAWNRFFEKRKPTPTDAQMASMIIFDSDFCERMEGREKSGDASNDEARERALNAWAELRTLLKDEGASRGLVWTQAGRFDKAP